MKIRIEFKKEDLWVGVFYKKPHRYWDDWHVWICLLPCFPIHIWGQNKDSWLWEETVKGIEEIAEGKGIPWEEVKKQADPLKKDKGDYYDGRRLT